MCSAPVWSCLAVWEIPLRDNAIFQRGTRAGMAEPGTIPPTPAISVAYRSDAFRKALIGDKPQLDARPVRAPTSDQIFWRVRLNSGEGKIRQPPESSKVSR